MAAYLSIIKPQKLMRLFLSLALIAGGLGLCLLDAFAHAFVRSDAKRYVRTQLQSLPQRPQYTSDELIDVIWQTWTNRLKLLPQETYSVTELKEVIAKPLIGSSQAVFDRYQIERAVERTAGFQFQEGGGGTFSGFICLLIGVFLIGGIIYPAKLKG
jgi:hypothetical protein